MRALEGPCVALCAIRAQAAQTHSWGSAIAQIQVNALGKPGNDLLSRALRHSTIGAGAFHGRVRDGIGCGRSASITRPTKGGDKSGPNMPGLHALDAQRAQAARSAVAQ